MGTAGRTLAAASVTSRLASDDWQPGSFDQEVSSDLGRQYLRQAIRLSLGFVLLFAGVFLILRWSGAAVGFGASRVGDRGTPTWHVIGCIRSAATHEAVAWAAIDDDSRGRPPFFHADADRSGIFDLLTLSEPHRIRVSAPGYRPTMVPVGRVWFLWIARGQERKDVELAPEPQ